MPIAGTLWSHKDRRLVKVSMLRKKSLHAQAEKLSLKSRGKKHEQKFFLTQSRHFYQINIKRGVFLQTQLLRANMTNFYFHLIKWMKYILKWKPRNM